MASNNAGDVQSNLASWLTLATDREMPAWISNPTIDDYLRIVAILLFLAIWAPPLVRWWRGRRRLVPLAQRPLPRLLDLRATLDRHIEFSWKHVTRGTADVDGHYNVVPLAPIPEANVTGGPFAVTTQPGAEFSFADNGGYKCELTNHSNVVLFNARITLWCTFFESVDNPPSTATITSQIGAFRQKGSGRELLRRPWPVFVPRLDIGVDHPFVFYLSSSDNYFVTVGTPDKISFKRLGSDIEEVSELVSPATRHISMWPPMNL